MKSEMQKVKGSAEGARGKGKGLYWRSWRLHEVTDEECSTGDREIVALQTEGDR